MLEVEIMKMNENLTPCRDVAYEGRILKWRIYYVFVGTAAKLRSRDLEVR